MQHVNDKTAFTSFLSFLSPAYDVIFVVVVLHAPCTAREVVGSEIKDCKYVMMKPIDITLGTPGI